jgi:hypothetical protein
MSIHALLLWGIVFAVGIPSAWRNPTAAALVICKIAGWAIYRITGDSLPVEYYLYPDLFVLAVIYAKHEHACYYPYRGFWHQLACVLLERSPADRVVVLIFPVMWTLYVAPIDPYYVWWSLYYLVIAQFLAAGWESFARFRRSRNDKKPKSIIDIHLIVAALFSPRAAERALLTYANGGGGDG